jgi:hypothetical protein
LKWVIIRSKQQTVEKTPLTQLARLLKTGIKSNEKKLIDYKKNKKKERKALRYDRQAIPFVRQKRWSEARREEKN